MEILQGFRECIVSGTPEDYVKIYTDCWDIEPDNRPVMCKVRNELKAMIEKTNINGNNDEDKSNFQLSKQQLCLDNVNASSKVTDILNVVIDLYKTAQHNKNITKVLMERIIAANSAVEILKAREDLFTLKNYTSLQILIQVLQKMKKFIEEITQYNTVQKFLWPKLIEKRFKELCKDYESSISLLDFTLTVDFRINSDKDDKILKEDIEDLHKFQEALEE
ncbi:14386_t:CDS:2, partial [Funneliformis geosporum]